MSLFCVRRIEHCVKVNHLSNRALCGLCVFKMGSIVLMSVC